MNIILGVALAIIGLAIGGCMINETIKASQGEHTDPQSSHFEDGKYHNVPPISERSTGETLGLFVRFFTEKKVNTVPEKSIPVAALSRAQLDALSDNTLHIVKLGHSSVLLKNHGEYWLLDPVFGERASPFSFIGPKRFHQPPITLDELPPIDRVLISHNHYDHLDKPSIDQLKTKARHFYVPNGVDGDLKKWGVSEDQISVFDWWQEADLSQGKYQIIFTPTQHFSGRGLGDGNQTLWGSWVIKSPDQTVYFSGDSGYFDGFKAIGERYGPFDMTFIETGAYDADWANVHMTPEQSVQAHLDLQGRIMVPIHNSTFDLAFHSWQDPLNRVSDAAKKHNVALSTPIFGELFQATDVQTKRWWEAL
ncbi:hydrolase [Marinomonas piezotolerans]|uniref:Hydrolase n=1 Tax=Marinomonas piezotolerans TaxID=2213058 RepID=A0A370UBX9_9GAMM|nr:MBL fold metallo-hydrolase [Marinomonas piezotolerans]RDL45249.1 hydrolase [Marinomonas piezotolerans]